jgi:hypothetical protein
MFKLDMEIPQYPYEFVDSDAYGNIDDNEINKWIHECIAYLEYHRDCNYRFISCANTYVFVQRYFIGDEEYNYEVIVAKNYQRATVYPE